MLTQDIELLKKPILTVEEENYLLKKLKSIKLLTPDFASAKMIKNRKFKKYQSFILHLSPCNLSGHNICPFASPGCTAACLNSAGRGKFNTVKAARMRKTLYLFKYTQFFMSNLFNEISLLEKKCKKSKKILTIRLNGTSDLNFNNSIYKVDGLTVFEKFPNVQFYDYTKDVNKILNNLHSNYSLTFSRSEINENDCLTVLRHGGSVAIVTPKKLNYWKRFKTVNGDEHDLRFLDRLNSVVVLTPKGLAKRDKSGFVLY